MGDESAAPNGTLTLTEQDLALLRLTGVVSDGITNLETLRAHLERAKDSRVRCTVLNMSGATIFADGPMSVSGLQATAPTVGRLREELCRHFETIAESYSEEMEAVEDKLRSVTTDPLASFWRPRPWRQKSDLRCYELKGVTFSSATVKNGMPLLPEFYHSWRYPQYVEFRVKERGFNCFEEEVDQSGERRGRRRRVQRPPSPSEYTELPWGGDIETPSVDDRGDGDVRINLDVFERFCANAAKGASLEFELGEDTNIFATASNPNRGANMVVAPGFPWTVTFASAAAKARFVETVSALALTLKIYADHSDEDPPPEFVEIFDYLLHRQRIADAMPQPHRNNFENNHYWYLTRFCCSGAYRFSLMAAESAEDPKVLSDSDSLLDLVGRAEAMPDRRPAGEAAGENMIQLRITTGTGG